MRVNQQSPSKAAQRRLRTLKEAFHGTERGTHDKRERKGQVDLPLGIHVPIPERQVPTYDSDRGEAGTRWRSPCQETKGEGSLAMEDESDVRKAGISRR